MMKCDGCGRKFKRGNFVDGTPNGMTFVLEDKNITVCRGCMIKLGMMNKEDKNKFLNELVRSKDDTSS